VGLIRLGMIALLGLFGLVSCTTTVDNPITGEKQRVQLSPQQEVALGLQARSEMAAQYGGLYPDNVLQQYVDQVGAQVGGSRARPIPSNSICCVTLKPMRSRYREDRFSSLLVW